jgi:hypothetical protein
MTDPIEFRANIGELQSGDDEIRIVLSVMDTPVDRAAALQMVTLRNRVLRVTARLMTEDEALTEFRCVISQIRTGIHFRKTKPPLIKFDIPASDGAYAARLVGYDEHMIRFEVSDEGAVPKKEPKPKKEKPKTPYGDLWQELLYRNMGFEFIAGVRESLEDARSSDRETPHDLMHKVFNVKSLSDLIGRDEIYAKWPPNEYPAVRILVEQALDRIEKRRVSAEAANNGVTKSIYLGADTDFSPDPISPYLDMHDEYDPDFDPMMG